MDEVKLLEGEGDTDYLEGARSCITGDGVDDAGRRRLYSHREVNSRGRVPREGYSKMLCVVYVCDDRNIHTHTHQHARAHAYYTTRERDKDGRDTYTHVDNTQTHTNCVNRYDRVCQVIMNLLLNIYTKYIHCFRLFC